MTGLRQPAEQSLQQSGCPHSRHRGHGVQRVQREPRQLLLLELSPLGPVQRGKRDTLQKYHYYCTGSTPLPVATGVRNPAAMIPGICRGTFCEFH